MPAEMGFQGQTSTSSRGPGVGPRDASPDSVIFTLESNFGSLFSSASASVDRCSFASDAHDHDSLASEISLVINARSYAFFTFFIYFLIAPFLFRREVDQFCSSGSKRLKSVIGCSIWQDLSMAIIARARVVQIRIQIQTNQQCTTITLSASTVVSPEKETNQKVPFDSMSLLFQPRKNTES